MNTPPNSLISARERKFRIAFEGVVSAFDESVQCETMTTIGVKCRLPAEWRVDVHGCERKVMCTGHLNNWRRQAEDVISRAGRTVCTFCGQSFESIEAVSTITAL